ncbi:MAG: hypothetical protein RIQ87_173 [Chloroflexota bacterium]|jgi:DNA polymerase III delta subunit
MESARILLTWGDDLLLIEEAVATLAAKMGAEDALGGAPDRIRLKAEGRGTGDASAVLNELRRRASTGGLFGGGALLIVAGAGRLGRSKELRGGLVEALGSMAPGNAVVLIDQRVRRPNLRATRPDSPGELGELVKDRGGTVVACISPAAGELAPWIVARAKSLGREIAVDAAREMATRIGAEVREPDLDRSGMRMTAAVELDKLMLAIPTGAIPLRAVDLLVADRGIGSLFAFADAIVARNGSMISRHLLRAVSDPGPMVVATLHRKMRDLAQIHGGTIEEGLPVSQVARRLGMHEFPAGKLAEAARRWRSDEITQAIEGLVELDAIAKGDGDRSWAPALTRWSASQVA